MNEIEFNKDEIKGTDETFFNSKDKNNTSDDSLDLDKSENIEGSVKDICDKSMEEEMSKVTLNNMVTLSSKLNHKLTKEDLNTIPIPIFECIFCANEKISFDHLINDALSLKYLYGTTKKDINLINELEKNNFVTEDEADKLKFKNDLDINKLKFLINFIQKNSEFLYKYYDGEESKKELCHKRKRENYKLKYIYDRQKDIKVKYNIENKKYGNENIELFDNDDDEEFLRKLGRSIKKISNNDRMTKDDEEKMCNSFGKLLNEMEFWNLERKIKMSDIDFEEQPYNIWNPIIDDEEDESLNQNIL